MKMYKVTIFCKKEWMPEAKAMQWAIMAEDPKDAIRKIKEENYVLDGVIIESEHAIETNCELLTTF